MIQDEEDQARTRVGTTAAKWENVSKNCLALFLVPLKGFFMEGFMVEARRREKVMKS